ELDGEVAPRDPRAAVSAAAPRDQKAEEGNQIARAQASTAGGAVRGRSPDRLLPRHTVDQDVQEAPHDETVQEEGDRPEVAGDQVVNLRCRPSSRRPLPRSGC